MGSVEGRGASSEKNQAYGVDGYSTSREPEAGSHAINFWRKP